MSSARNASEIAFLAARKQPPAEIVRVEGVCVVILGEATRGRSSAWNAVHRFA